jgi:hypothetical protein
MKYFTKEANMSDWLNNRKEDWNYLRYLAQHKADVYRAGRELGADRWPLIKHDWSKFLPSLWTPYREKFFGDGGNEAAFRRAVQRHVDLESHHDYKYKPETGAIPNAENIADWYAVTKSKNPELTLNEFLAKQKNLDKK